MLKKRLATLMIMISAVMTVVPSEALQIEGMEEQLQVSKPIQVATKAQLDITTEAAVALQVLDDMVAEGTMLTLKAPIGTTPGAYTLEAKEALEMATARGRYIVETEIDEVLLEKAIHILHNEMKNFKKARKIDVGQVALGAYYYGVRKGEGNWTHALWLDINCDGKVTVEDISWMAAKVLNCSFEK